jgi:ABC-type glycerol-3-phosphate transport system substrate-binding protein
MVKPEELKGIKIRFWHPWTGDLANEVAAIANEFNQANLWGIQVETNAPGGSLMLYEQVKQNLAESSLPEVIAAPIDQLQDWQSSNQVVVNLNDYIQSTQWGMQATEIKDFQPVFWQQDQVDGVQLAIPAVRDAQVLFYNRSWANEMGFTTAPATPQDFEKQACTALQANVRTQRVDKIGTGGWIIDSDPLPMLSWFLAFTGQPIPTSDAQSYTFNSPQVQESISYLNGLFKKTCIWPGRLPTPYEYFTRRMALFYSGAVTDIPTQTRLQQVLKSNDNWTIIPYPTLLDKPVVLMNGPSYAVLKSNPQKQLAAWLFIRWLTLPRNQARLVKTSGYLPVSLSAIEMLQDYGRLNPQWNQALVLIPLAYPAPNLASWRVASTILQDAGWQIFHQPPTPIPVPTILQQLDETIPQIVNGTPTSTNP